MHCEHRALVILSCVGFQVDKVQAEQCKLPCKVYVWQKGLCASAWLFKMSAWLPCPHQRSALPLVPKSAPLRRDDGQQLLIQEQAFYHLLLACKSLNHSVLQSCAAMHC